MGSWRCLAFECGAGERLGTRRTASCDQPRCREQAICVHDHGRYERLDDRRGRSSGLGCGASSRGVRGSLADHIREVKKRFCSVTTRNRNFWVLTGFGSGLGSLAARSLCLGVLGSGGSALAMLGLPPCCLPPLDQPQAIWLLTVALVPAPGLVLATTSFAQAAPRSRLAPSGQTTPSSRNVASAHGRCFLPRESPGRMCHHSPRALSRCELDAASQSIVTREQDRELNGF
jgi:hypothetical protein